jgi:hypothetical protein
MNKKSINEIIGWYGAIAILLAYVLISFDVFNSSNIFYQSLNGTGAIGIVYHSFKKKDYQPGVLNIFWALIALFAIIRILL